jgi:hypothetical protein
MWSPPVRGGNVRDLRTLQVAQNGGLLAALPRFIATISPASLVAQRRNFSFVATFSGR